MSTNNFSWENVLIVCPDFTFKNICMEESCDNFESEDNCEHNKGELYYDFDIEGFRMYKKDIQSQLEKLGFSSCDKSDYDRNYQGNIIAVYDIFDKNNNIYKTISVIIRNGYYEGMNIDYTISEELEEGCKGTKTLDKKINTLCNKIKKIFREEGTELIQLGTMSNGEGVYKLKNNINK